VAGWHIYLLYEHSWIKRLRQNNKNKREREHRLAIQGQATATDGACMYIILCDKNEISAVTVEGSSDPLNLNPTTVKELSQILR
jgi:hypothetical protein